MNKLFNNTCLMTSCAAGADGSITFDNSGTYYFVVRSGGFTFGDGGIVVDDIEMVTTD